MVWNSVTNTDYNKIECIKKKFAALCHNRFFHDMEYHYINMLDKLNLRSLHTRQHIDALFPICVFKGVKKCPSVLETVSIRFPSRNIRNFSPFCCTSSNCPSARCVSATNIVCNSLDIFKNSNINLKNLFMFFL
jgi:hypothetical protein